MPPNTAGGSAQIFRAVIYNVHYGKYLVDVRSLFGNLDFKEAELGAAYQHSDGPEGSYVEPEVGAECLVCVPGDGTRAVVISFTREFADEDGAKGDRPSLGPGDQIVHSRDGNYVVVRRGGLIEIRSTAQCQTVYVPIQNLIRTFFSNWEAKSLLGEASWRHSPLEEGAELDGGTEVLFTFRTREYTEDAKQSVTLRCGYVPVQLLAGADAQIANNQASTDQVYFEMELTPQGLDSVFVCRMDKAGNLFMQVGGKASFEFIGPVYLRTKSTVTWKGAADTDVQVSATGTITSTIGEIVSTILRRVFFKTPLFDVQSPNIRLGEGQGLQPGVLGREQLDYNLNHTHEGAGPPSSNWQVKAAGILAQHVRLK
jgi:hypothetical protein